MTGWSHILAVSRLADLANFTNRQTDAQEYYTLAKQLKAVYHKTYFSEADGYYKGGSQTAQVLPLYLGLTPPGPALDSTLQQLRQSLASRHNTTSSGIVGTAYLLQVLHAHDPVLALEIATQTTKPSWGYMVKMGPGTFWESWTDSTNSHNHPALGATISRYLYQLAGFSSLDATAWLTGVVQIRPSPPVVFLLGSANATVSTVHGPMTVAWTASEGNMRLRANIPIGLEGEVHLPAPNKLDCQVVDPAGQTLWSAAGWAAPKVTLHTDHADGGRTASVRVKGGEHIFALQC